MHVHIGIIKCDNCEKCLYFAEILFRHSFPFPSCINPCCEIVLSNYMQNRVKWRLEYCLACPKKRTFPDYILSEYRSQAMFSLPHSPVFLHCVSSSSLRQSVTTIMIWQISEILICGQEERITLFRFNCLTLLARSMTSL